MAAEKSFIVAFAVLNPYCRLFFALDAHSLRSYKKFVKTESGPKVMRKEQFTIRLPQPIAALIFDFMAKYGINMSTALVMMIVQWDELVNKPATATPQSAAKPKGKELPPVKVWDGDPYQDPDYFPPEQRAGLYRAEQWSPKRIREHENLVMRKWPQAETVYEAGLVREE